MTPGRRRAVLAAAAAGSLLFACARRAPIAFPERGGPSASGYRALFRVRSDGPAGKERFRMAAALAPPDGFRLEFFGPVGGPRLVVAARGVSAVALLPQERAFDVGEASAEALDRLLGVPLDTARLVALLTGRPMCRPESVEQHIRTRRAATFARTVAWFDITCPPGDVRYLGRCKERGGVVEGAVVRDGIGGDIILTVDYADYGEGPGPRWPRKIRLHLARRRTTVTLEAIDGPSAGDLPRAIFTPSIPEGFERRAILSSLPAPGLLGSTAVRER
ncbi:MAG: hypothetical protein ACE5JH_04135 [Acidobacteriota bacterium]